ncbi:protein kinase domain-containing protein [Nocardia salmonicida]|uniref:protein kinase domain-containing protein n=1 Tax=Nocardia salmonicida TaxID=53431 RepID=UPI0033E1786A
MADNLPTQRSSATGIATELAAEGFEDAEEIGRGGFGVVYRCAQPDLDRVVAVKVLTAELDPDGLQRFVREQQAMGRLSGHPNIVAVFHAGTTHGGHPFLVMPYHARGSLEQRIHASGPLDWTATLRLGVKIAGALETAHRSGILHRDVKPSNILLSDYNEPELTDFGIARTPGGFRTTTGIVTGSPAFAAPEVLRGASATPAADVYGLGATLFCSLTGHVAYERRVGEQVLSQFLRVSAHPGPDLTDHDVPDEVRAVIEHAMATDPADRPDNAAALGAELVAAQRSTGIPEDVLRVPSAQRHATAPLAPSPPPHGRTTAPPSPATKYRPPTTARATFTRKRLLDYLRTSDRTRLISIHAPSGFGKTTLAAQWRDELVGLGGAVAWLTVDEDDDNVTWFLAHLVEAIRPTVTTLADDLDQLLETDSDDLARAVLTALLDGLHTGDQRVTLVLDDWQRVTGPASVSAVQFLLEHGCHHLPLILTSTARLDMPLSRLRMHGELTEIDATTLRFDQEEVQAFLTGAPSVHLTADEIAAFARATDGWVAALQLTVLSLRAGEDPAHLLDSLAVHTDIGDFLAENVLDGLDPDTLDFLMTTSICERICGGLAAALTRRTDATEMLADIADRGLFLLPASPDRAWYRYHQLFAGYLCRRLAQDRPEEIAALRLRAAGWLARHHLLNDAVDQALAAGDPEHAADFVEEGAAYLLERSKMMLLRGILAKLPSGVCRTRPRIQLFSVWGHLVLRRTTAAFARFETALASADLAEPERISLRAEADVAISVREMFADRVAELEGLISEALARPDTFPARVPGVAANIATYAAIHRFDFDEARRRQLWAAPYHEATGPFLAMYGRCFAGLAAKEQLDIEGAADMFTDAVATASATMGPASHATRLACAVLGELRYETGDLDAAADLLAPSRELSAEGGGGVDFMLATYATGARVRTLRGDREGARELLEEGMQQAERLNLPRLAARIHNERVRLGFALDPGVSTALLRPRKIRRDDGIAAAVDELDEDSAIRLLLAEPGTEQHRLAVERATVLVAGIDADRRPMAALRAGFLLASARGGAGHVAAAERMYKPLARRCASLGLVRLPEDASAP